MDNNELNNFEKFIAIGAISITISAPVAIFTEMNPILLAISAILILSLLTFSKIRFIDRLTKIKFQHTAKLFGINYSIITIIFLILSLLTIAALFIGHIFNYGF